MVGITAKRTAIHSTRRRQEGEVLALPIAGRGVVAPSASPQDRHRQSRRNEADTQARSLFAKKSREKSLFLLFRNQAEAKDVPVEFHLVLRELQKFSFACDERMSVE